METLIGNIYKQATALGCCKKFTGNEDLSALVRLFLSPEGMEFCINNHFPHISTFRSFKSLNLERWGIYIDAGEITLKNPEKAVLVGRTAATIYCDDNKHRNEVFLFHGATASINASKWSVTFVKAERGGYVKLVKDNAIVL